MKDLFAAIGLIVTFGVGLFMASLAVLWFTAAWQARRTQR